MKPFLKQNLISSRRNKTISTTSTFLTVILSARTFITGTFLVLCIASGKTQHADCDINEIRFLPGESITYVISYNWFIVFTDVGEVNFRVTETNQNKNPLLHLQGYGYTYKNWDLFFKVRDKYESWVDPNTLKPVFYKRDVYEGGFKIDINYRYLRKQNLAYSYSKANEDPAQLDTVEITDCTFDIVSIIYYMRNIEMAGIQKNDTIPLTILLDREVYSLYVRYLGKEDKKVKGVGKFKCLKFSASVVKGTVFKGGETLKLWVTDDKNRIPVYAESPIIVGNIKVKIKSWENLKYNLNAFSID
jgi:hypothetical protein